MAARRHHFSEVIDGTLSLTDEVEHRQQQLALLARMVRVAIGVGQDDLIAFRRRWWLLKR